MLKNPETLLILVFMSILFATGHVSIFKKCYDDMDPDPVFMDCYYLLINWLNVYGK